MRKSKECVDQLYVAATGGLDGSIDGPSYAGGVCWTIVYDTLFADQNKSYDVKIGIRSTTLLFDRYTVYNINGRSAPIK